MAKMKITTLCYIECGGKVLMMYRNKKQNDQNEGKWVAVSYTHLTLPTKQVV